MEVNRKTLKLYRTLEGISPFIEWFEVLDFKTQTIIDKRLDRLELGNFGDSKSLKNGIYEARIHYGAGIRVYFGLQGEEILVLLAGGIKRSQKRDIRTAISFWEDYKKRLLISGN